jgi:hypothetical protein
MHRALTFSIEEKIPFCLRLREKGVRVCDAGASGADFQTAGTSGRDGSYITGINLY